MRACFIVEMQLSLEIETQLPCFAKTRGIKYWRDVVFRVEMRLLLCWNDADFNVETQTSFCWRDATLLNVRLAFWVRCHVSSGVWSDAVLLECEVRVIGALPRVWWWLVSRYGPRILTDYCIYKKTAVFQESSLGSFLLHWTLHQEF